MLPRFKFKGLAEDDSKYFAGRDAGAHCFVGGRSVRVHLNAHIHQLAVQTSLFHACFMEALLFTGLADGDCGCWQHKLPFWVAAAVSAGGMNEFL